MAPRQQNHEQFVEYWTWFLGAVIILIPIDILTTIVAVNQYGLSGEQNQFVALLLQAPWYVLLVVNFGFAALAIGFFYGVLEMAQSTPDRLQSAYYRVIEVWIGGLLAVGLAVFANNLTTIVLGESLFVFL